MKIESDDGCFVELRVQRYQFPVAQSTWDRDWDANWLVIRGHVWDGVQSWSFEDPCMTTWEARELGPWLRALDQQRPAAKSSEVEGSGERFWFTEPNVTFQFDRFEHGLTSLSVYFTLESAPPGFDWIDGLGHRVRLLLPQAFVARAADDWEQELASFPER